MSVGCSACKKNLLRVLCIIDNWDVINEFIKDRFCSNMNKILQRKKNIYFKTHIFFCPIYVILIIFYNRMWFLTNKKVHKIILIENFSIVMCKTKILNKNLEYKEAKESYADNFDECSQNM